MKKVLFLSLLLVGFVCVGCQSKENYENNDSNDVVVEEIDVEEIDGNEEKNNDNFENADIMFNKGKKALEEDNNPDEAINFFNKALELKKDVDWIYGDLGRAKYAKKDFDGAIECYTKAIELNNNRSVYYQWRADAYREKGKEDLAEQDQKKGDDLHAKGMD